MEHSLDSIISPKFRFYQPLNGYRITIDTVILYNFALPYTKGRVLEIGSASGVISILLSKDPRVTRVTGVEVNPVPYQLSLKNQGMHDCGERVLFLNEDIKNFKGLFKPQSFDTIITNPPFYKYGTGRLNKRQEVTTAHHDKHLTLDMVFKSSRYLLRPGGYLIILFTAHRMGEVLLSGKGFNIEVLRFIHRKVNKPADAFLMLAKKGGGKQLSVVPPLIVHKGAGYSEEVMEMLNARV